MLCPCVRRFFMRSWGRFRCDSRGGLIGWMLALVMAPASSCYGQSDTLPRGASSSPARPSGLSSSPRVEAVLEPIRAVRDIPGLAAAVIRGEDVVAIGAVGVRRAGDPKPVTVDDRFHLGSCTKAMTATLIAQLVEEGSLSWSTTLAESFPELASTMHSDYRNVTLEQLLAHRGGVPTDLNAGGLWMRLWRHTGTPVEQRRTLVEGVLTSAPQAPPGTQFIYANGGYAIAGAIAEKKTGKPWEDLMTQRLFEPLGMNSAGFGAPGDAEKLDQPWGHRLAGGKLVPVAPGPMSDNPAAIGPAGTVHATLPDWARFISLHLRGAQSSGRLLKPDTFRKLHTPVSGQDYALGWIVTDRPWGGTVFTHAGSNTMWYCVAWLAPQKNFAVIVACNRGDEAAAKGCDEVAWGLIQNFLLQPPKAEKSTAP